MKCIKNILTKEIERVSDDEAHSRAGAHVMQEVWRYAPKHLWKQQRTNPTE